MYESGGAAKVNVAVSDAKGARRVMQRLMPSYLLAAPRRRFKMVVSVADFGVQCTQKVHNIIWGTAHFCENVRLFRCT